MDKKPVVEPPVMRQFVVQPDRVFVSMKFTRRPAEYESVGAEIGLDSSVQKGESIEQAFERVGKLVNHEYNELMAQYEKQYGK